MLSVTRDSSVSPKKRTYTRGMSEDESLRNIIKETENSTRRLTRSDSRAGTLKRRPDSQQSDQDVFMGIPEMLELQASYDEAVQELHGLEVEREALLFQVDVLQDTLQGVEELLAEAQREAGQVSLELEQERVAKRKLESLVGSLMQEVERLKEEKKNGRSAPVSDEATGREHQMNNSALQKEDKDSSLCESCRRPGGLTGADHTGSVPVKLHMMGHQSLGLAVDNVASIDGVHGRPYKNHMDDGREPSPDRNDSDSLSAYEDASAETPEQDRIFPGDEELPDDSEESRPGGCRVDGSESQNPADSCILS